MTNRDAWLERAAADARRFREEDRANGITWADEQQLHPVEVIDHDTGKTGPVLFPMGEK